MRDDIVNTGIYRRNLHFEVMPTVTEEEKQRELPGCSEASKGPASSTLHGEGRRGDHRVSGRAGPSVARYHGKLGAGAQETQDASWRASCGSIVATNAFGMGIDKPDIRFVVHYNLPGRLSPTTRKRAAPAATASRRAARSSTSRRTTPSLLPRGQVAELRGHCEH